MDNSCRREEVVMDIVSFYQKLINPPLPWRVSRVEVHDECHRIDVWLEHPKGATFPCPDCDTLLPVYDHTPERGWRHLDTCDYETWLHAELPRVFCSRHGTLQATPPLGGPYLRLTSAMERRCIDTLKECSREGAATLTGLSWDEVDAVMSRAVTRGMDRRSPVLPEWLGIDEKSVFARHRYFTILTDLKKGLVLDVIDKRTMIAVEPWFQQHQERLGDIKGVAMDMSACYANVVSHMMPNAEICYDHFHVTMKVNGAVDEVRKQEQRLMPDDQGRGAFFRSRFLFLYNEENVPKNRADEFGKLKEVAVKTSRAWAIKEHFREIWKCPTPETAALFFKKWYWWATHSRLEPMRKAAHTIKNHWAGIANAITRHITNACTEGLNSKIEKIKRDAFGFRNKEKFRTAILFHCGGLDLYPTSAIT
jgi:transposase